MSEGKRGRKVVIIGDTNDATNMLPIARNADVNKYKNDYVCVDILMCYGK